jgi:hypothetical protein
VRGYGLKSANKSGASTPRKLFIMNSFSWNIRGIDAVGRKKSIYDNLAKAKPTIVSFQATKKESFSSSYLDSISMNMNFVWNHLPSKGSAGGIWVGVDSNICEVLSWEIKSVSVSCTLRNRLDSVIWRHISIYGSPYEGGKEDFISELHSLFVDSSILTLISGDFNLVRYQEDKSN